MITASVYFVIMFLLCHLLGDYILGQSDWMALNKSRQTIPCLAHVILYTSFFLILTTSWKALLFIGATHFILDRFPVIIKRLIWLKNHINPTFSYPPFEYCNTTGYYDDSPYNTKKLLPTEKEIVETKGPFAWGKPRHFHITIFLYIVTDNTLHLICNFIALALLA
jgi:hypothetical protein